MKRKLFIDEDDMGDIPQGLTDDLFSFTGRTKKRRNPMARSMNLAAVKAAIASTKTPAPLKKGLIKKYGHLLGSTKMSMSTLATTMTPNPKKKFSGDFGKGYIGNPVKWYWGVFHQSHKFQVFHWPQDPTKKSHGSMYRLCGGPFSSKAKATQAAQYQGYVKYIP